MTVGSFTCTISNSALSKARRKARRPACSSSGAAAAHHAAAAVSSQGGAGGGGGLAPQSRHWQLHAGTHRYGQSH
jgi:hypothetical protein